MQEIILVGGGGHCRSVIDVIEEENKYKIIGILDNNLKLGERVLNYPVIGNDDELKRIFLYCQNAFVTVGHVRSNTVRVKLFKTLKEIGYNIPTIISPIAYVSKHAKIEEGTIIMHQALINSNVKIGKNCIINSKALLEHDCIVEDNCHISTGAILNGGVYVKENTFYGSNATCKEMISVEGFIKAGSIVK